MAAALALLGPGAAAQGSAAPERLQPVPDGAAAGFTALARVLPAETALAAEAPGALALELGLSQPVPWRVRLMDAPPRLLLDFRELDFAALPAGLGAAPGVVAVRSGLLEPGWSRLVVEMDGPRTVAQAAMRTGLPDGSARLSVRLEPADAEAFAGAAARPDPSGWRPVAPSPQPRGSGPLTVVLDPGHGGIDPGAEHGGLREADLMLTFARELREALLRAGGFTVAMTREEDVFVSLDARVRIARAAGADVFLSLHADALPDGQARGATVYTLAEEASDAASAALAARHDRADLLAGVDLSGQDDLIAQVLMSIARTETAPRTERLADALVAGITDATGRMHRRPHQWAAFSVLRAPDIPSALIELGFLSNPDDRARLSDPEWRARFAAGIVAGLQDWALADAAEAPLRRR